jgi:hypothetical protein
VEVAAEENWGEDDWNWVHTCQGHMDQYNSDFSAPYKPSDRPEDQGAPVIEDDR